MFFFPVTLYGIIQCAVCKEYKMGRAASLIIRCITVLAMIAFVVVFFLTIVFPMTLSVWAEQGRELSGFWQVVANMSTFCKSYGIIILVFLMGIVVGSNIWMLIATRVKRFSLTGK